MTDLSTYEYDQAYVKQTEEMVGKYEKKNRDNAFRYRNHG